MRVGTAVQGHNRHYAGTVRVTQRTRGGSASAKSGNAAAGSNVRSPVAQVNGPGRVTSTAPPAGVETTWAPAKGAGHEWADIPASRGRDDAKGSFGSVVLPFFSDT